MALDETENAKPQPVLIGNIGGDTSPNIVVGFYPERNPRDMARTFLIVGLISATLIFLLGISEGDLDVICCSGWLCTGGIFLAIICEFSYMKMYNEWRKQNGMDRYISPWLVIIGGIVGFFAFAIFLDVVGI